MMDLGPTGGVLAPAGKQRITAVRRVYGFPRGFGLRRQHTPPIPRAAAHAMATALVRILTAPGWLSRDG
jgi:hypothetical protein